MEKEALKKVMLKVVHEERHAKKRALWTPLCYVNSSIYNTFFSVFKIEKSDLCDFISKWVQEDFNLTFDFTKKNDMRILKELVSDKYRILYPYIYYSDLIDGNGWVRVWISEKMGKEIKRYDREQYKQLFKSS